MKPARGLVLVRRVETDETIPGGRIILTQNERENMAAYQCEVVAVGSPERCEKPKKCNVKRHLEWFRMPVGGTMPRDCVYKASLHEHNLKAGDWVLIRPRSLTQPNSEKKEYLVRQSDVMAVFRSEG